MIFECDGEVVDTNRMLSPSIDDPYAVGVFITRDYSRVFGAFMYGDEGLRMQRVQGEQLRLIAQRTRAKELFKAVARENRRRFN